jgi:periplasmic copper chaperone A
MRLFVFSVALYLTLATTAHACDLEVTDPWIREAPPTATALAGYMVLSNSGGQDCVFTDVRAADFEVAMIHRTEHDGDTAHMVHQNEVNVPAGGETIFKPNGLHIMLMHPRRSLSEGDSVVVTLVLEGGDEHGVELPVRRSPPR